MMIMREGIESTIVFAHSLVHYKYYVRAEGKSLWSDRSGGHSIFKRHYGFKNVIVR